MKQPVLVYSDENGEVNLIGNYTSQDWEENSIADYRDFRVDNLKKTRPDVEILTKGIKEVNGKKSHSLNS